MNPSKKYLILSAVFLTVFILEGVFLISRLARPSVKDQSETPPVTAPAYPFISVYELVLGEARRWRKDAVLSYSSNSPGADSKTPSMFIFVSPSFPNTGFVVESDADKVISSREISYSGEGGEFRDNLITQEEAIKRVHSIAGFEDAEIVSVEGVYGPEGKIWYWGVKTNKGTVSVKTE